jgi:hypothetical protein
MALWIQMSLSLTRFCESLYKQHSVNPSEKTLTWAELISLSRIVLMSLNSTAVNELEQLRLGSIEPPGQLPPISNTHTRAVASNFQHVQLMTHSERTPKSAPELCRIVIKRSNKLILGGPKSYFPDNLQMKLTWVSFEIPKQNNQLYCSPQCCSVTVRSKTGMLQTKVAFMKVQLGTRHLHTCKSS